MLLRLLSSDMLKKLFFLNQVNIFKYKLRTHMFSVWAVSFAPQAPRKKSQNEMYNGYLVQLY